MTLPRVLTVAGSDSGGGAGIQADLKTFMAHGTYGMSALTAVTAQNTVTVAAVELLPAALVTAQIDAVLTDIGADAVKTGMLGDAAIIGAVAEALQRHNVQQLVVDPVMIAKSGDRLLAEAAVDALRTRLLPLALVLTPNLPEAAALLNREVRHEAQMVAAAHDLLALGPRYVLLKGGHLTTDEVVDVLVGDGKTLEFRSRRVETRHTHGTGCTYAAGIAAQLALGRGVAEAVRESRTYLMGAIANAWPLGHGHGPVHHLWRGLPAG